VLEYVVDFLGFREESWMVGDQDDWEPRPYPQEKHRKKGRTTIGEPFNLTLTSHCNSRARDGWRLHSMTPCVEDKYGPATFSAGPVLVQGMWLVFERERS